MQVLKTRGEISGTDFLRPGQNLKKIVPLIRGASVRRESGDDRGSETIDELGLFERDEVLNGLEQFLQLVESVLFLQRKTQLLVLLESQVVVLLSLSGNHQNGNDEFLNQGRLVLSILNFGVVGNVDFWLVVRLLSNPILQIFLDQFFGFCLKLLLSPFLLFGFLFEFLLFFLNQRSLFVLSSFHGELVEVNLAHFLVLLGKENVVVSVSLAVVN